MSDWGCEGIMAETSTHIFRVELQPDIYRDIEIVSSVVDAEVETTFAPAIWWRLLHKSGLFGDGMGGPARHSRCRPRTNSASWTRPRIGYGSNRGKPSTSAGLKSLSVILLLPVRPKPRRPAPRRRWP